MRSAAARRARAGKGGPVKAPLVAPSSPRELLLASLPVLRELVAFLARRYRLSAEQSEELEALARLHLVEDDYSVLRQWRRQSTVKTYLAVVVQRLFHDYCNQLWGKWRASAAAQRLGPVAQALEELLYREGLTFDEAVRVITADPHVDPAQLAALHSQLPPRPGRPRPQPLGARAAAEPEPGPTPEDAALQRAAEAIVTRTVAASLHQLRAHDRLLLRLHFGQGLSVAAVARLVDIPQKTLYKRFTAVLRGLRRDLASAGFERHDAAALLQRGPTLDFGLASDGENGLARPSKQADDGKEPRGR